MGEGLMRRLLASRFASRAGRLLVTIVQVLAIAAAAGPRPAAAEEGPDLAIVGARARGMGSAYTAVSDGIESVGWNPAGLAFIRGPRLAADMRLHFGSGTVTQGIPIFSGGGAPAPVDNFTDTPSSRFTYYLIGGAAPLPIKGWVEDYGLVGSLVYRRVMDRFIGREQLIEFDPGGGFTIPFEHIVDEQGGIDAWTLSLAGRAHELVALGFNLNFLTNTYSATDEQVVAFQGQEFYRAETQQRSDFGGFSFELGATIEPMTDLKLAGVMRPSYDLKQTNGRGRVRLEVAPGAGVPEADTLIQYEVPDITSDVPFMYGIGAAYRLSTSPLSGLLIAADYQYRPWNEMKSVADTEQGPVELETFSYPTHTVSVGGEYVFNRDSDVQVPLRLGFHSAPSVQANVDSLSTEIGADGYRNFRGSRVEGNTWAFGAGIHFPSVAFDVSLDFTKHTFSEFLFGNAPPPGVQLDIVELEETMTNLYFSSTLRF